MQTNSFSTLDLSFVSINLFNISHISLGPDLGSDHLPVIIEISRSLQTYKARRRVKWIFDREAWSSFSASLPELKVSGDLEEDFSSLSSAILKTGEKFFKKTKEYFNIKYSKPWWNLSCETKIKEKQKARNKFKKHPTMENYNIFKEKEKEASKVIKTSKIESFRNFCNEINVNTPNKIIWNKIAALSKKYKPMKPIPLLHNKKFITNPEHKANLIADNFEKTFNVECNSNISSKILIPITIAILEDCYQDYNNEITLYELQNAVNNLKLSCAGEDLIHNSFIKNLPTKYLKIVLTLFNKSLLTGKIPTQ